MDEVAGARGSFLRGVTCNSCTFLVCSPVVLTNTVVSYEHLLLGFGFGYGGVVDLECISSSMFAN